MTLFSRAGTSSALEFCIGDMRSVFPMENSYLYIENNLKETNPTINILPCRQPLVSHILH